jgi:hypothetical protein
MTSYASYTRGTAEPIKAIAHARRFQQAAKIIAALPSDTVLDYGCADAHLFSVLGPVRERAGYEPDPKMVAQIDPNLSDIRVYTDRSELLSSGRRFSLITCMEVCEHLTPKSLNELFHTVRSLCLPNARVVFGVPIETGLSGFAKGVYRTLKKQDDASISNSFKSLFGARIDRRVTDVEWYGAHTGFDDETFADELAKHFSIKSTACLPLPVGRVFNNEIYYVCRALPAPT